jgi:GH24 family phage-related lysozyme (muramidase)
LHPKKKARNVNMEKRRNRKDRSSAMAEKLKLKLKLKRADSGGQRTENSSKNTRAQKGILHHLPQYEKKAVVSFPFLLGFSNLHATA